MPEAIAGAIGYFQTGVFIYGNSAYLGAAYFVTLVGGCNHGEHHRQRAKARAAMRAAP